MENEEIRKERTDFWGEYWPKLQEATKETEEHIDKKIYGITVGGIGAEIASLQYLKSIDCKILAILASGFFIAALLLNLYSHVTALKSHEKQGDSIQQFFDDANAIDDSEIYKTAQRENKKITLINHISIWTMALAIGLLIAFIVVNI